MHTAPVMTSIVRGFAFTRLLTMGATVVLIGTPSFEKTAARVVVNMPKLLRSISTCIDVVHRQIRQEHLISIFHGQSGS